MPDAGDVVWLQFPGVVATKRRPAVILSTAEYHATRPDVIVGLVTSQTAKAIAATDHVLSDWQAAGLRVPSAFRSFIATVPQSSINATTGRVSAADWKEIQGAVQRALAI